MSFRPPNFIYNTLSMAHKENVPPPHPPPLAPCHEEHWTADKCTPPSGASATLGLRPWQTSPFAAPPFRALSPSSKPALSRQRDHSACRHPETPLRVRKTRENLKHDATFADIPPPCLHVMTHVDGPEDMNASKQTDFGSAQHANALQPSPQTTNSRPSTQTCASSLCTLPSHLPEDFSGVAATTPALSPRTMQRHKSVSRRMLSKVKQGISNRAKGSPSVRPIESDASLMRRLSGRRKCSDEVERRTQSFETNQDGIISVPEDEIHRGNHRTHFRQRSLTTSTISNGALLRNDAGVAPSIRPSRCGMIKNSECQSSDKPHEHNPYPISKVLPQLHNADKGSLQCRIPFVELSVSTDHDNIDSSVEKGVWVAIEASVSARPCILSDGGVEFSEGARETPHDGGETILGTITSLRLCFKPADGCIIVNLVGQKTQKNLVVGQSCSLFVMVQVPKVRPATTVYAEDDQASLFADLESIVGVLETELLHVEARYRHSMLPSSNVVAIREVAKVRRPKLDSRWSLSRPCHDVHVAEQVHTKLAIHIADHYPCEKVLRLIDRYLSAEAMQEEPVRQIRQSIAEELNGRRESGNTFTKRQIKPSVVVTDIDHPTEATPASLAEDGSTASRPLVEDKSSAMVVPARHVMGVRSASLAALTNLAPPSSEVTTLKSSPSAANATVDTLIDGEDDAHKLWRHMRRSSLSAQRLAELADSEKLEQLAVSDDIIQDLRRKALANKRSVGAETLKGWKWDEHILREKGAVAEMPWL
ncbi:hypothetical protein M433DRAFT_409473 [Acidomyces richmondensis BFW]|nr:hypothetical protein M433DRAFT_409473 [Acidomyces richmondensis BFW]